MTKTSKLLLDTRSQYKLSQVDLATMIGLWPQYLSKIEGGHLDMPLDTARAFIKCFPKKRTELITAILKDYETYLEKELK